MKRTQIYIDDETFGKLKSESSLKGVSISEIIRDSVHNTLGSGVEKIIRAADSVSGVWSDRDFDVDAFIRSARKDRKI
jgi:hypothetical protein